MRVRQETYVEYQVRIVGHAVFESEADERDKNRLAAGTLLKLVDNMRAQLVDIELRRVDDHVSQVAQEIEPLAFRADRG